MFNFNISVFYRKRFMMSVTLQQADNKNPRNRPTENPLNGQTENQRNDKQKIYETQKQ